MDVLPEQRDRRPAKRSPLLIALQFLAAALVVAGIATVVLRVDLSNWSLLGLPLRVVLVILAVGAFAAAIVWGGHWWRRALFVILAVVLGVAFAAAQANAHYEYVRTVGELFGETSQDETSVAGVVRDGQLPAEGKVVELPIPGVRSGFTPRNAQVYLPPAWFRDTKRQFPVVLLLHGSPGFPEDWVRGGLADVTADKFAQQHDGNAPIIVMPDINGTVTGDSECVDSPRGNVETYLNVDVRNFVIDRFDTSNQPDKWAVAGLSEGGNCAVMMVLRRPDLYKTFGDYAGLSGPRPGESDTDTAGAVRELFGGSQQRFEEHEPSFLLQQKKYPGVGGWFEVASDDRVPMEAAEKLAPLAKGAGIETCLVVLSGGSHTFGVFSRSFKDSLPWLSARVGLIPKAPAQTAGCKT